MHIIQWIEWNVFDTMHRIQCNAINYGMHYAMHILQCINQNEYNAMHIKKYI